MDIPEGYIEALTDELAPHGLEFGAVSTDEDNETAIRFDADPDSFVHLHPGLGIEDSYGTAWPPAALHLVLKFDGRGDPIQADFEVFDLLSWAASADPEMHDRLNTMGDWSSHAVAVGEALGRVLEQEGSQLGDYLD